ncbi:MAG: 50S ribosomal protein L31e [Desulfurococcales archaeon]|nr:50S ribosomal protein L31e [Desulfurococcales archaeon]
MPSNPGYYVYIVPLSRVYWGRRTNRADRAVKLVRRFVERHTKAERVVIDTEVNNYIWSRGREKPPRRIKILVKLEKEKVEGEEEKEVLVARVRLAGPRLKPGVYEAKTKGKKG